MKKILILLTVLYVCCFQQSCNKPDEHFRDLMEVAETRVYPGGIDSIIVSNGIEQFTVDIMIPPNGTASKFALVNGVDTSYYDFPLDKSVVSQKVVVKNVKPGQNPYEIFTINTQGNVSPKKYFFNSNAIDANIKLQNLNVKRGFNRARLDFTPPTGNSVAKIALAEAGKDTIILDIPFGNAPLQLIIPNLEEGNHSFDLILIASDGSKSNSTPISVNVYGDKYKSSLVTVGLTSGVYYSTYFDYYVYLANIPSNTEIVGRKIRYKPYYDTAIKEVTYSLLAQQFWLANSTGGTYATSGFYYWNEYLPTNGIDKVNSPEIFKP
ncbi:DUF4998 domain-containing protein [Sphingobacterium bovistauri]|uniref:DUF4842 domain-containing protein n=1 Tax=Sphingobacterium bovistauri TaxID=2781959 RepID=A0ABS7Z8I9_9SPHI|nr:DUF4998 domain-containing protein [Sphingobacterium bovistauri]MCA5005185.1 hypothetical protein [Sphingobacterium bovistauri]